MRWLVAAASILLAGATTLGTPPPNAQALLDDLASDDFTTRQRATVALLAASEMTVDDVVRLAADARTAEQRARLTLIAKHHYVRPLQEQRAREAAAAMEGLQQRGPGLLLGPDGGEAGAATGSLGVSVVGGVKAADLPEVGYSAARIGVTYPGFPAYVYLQPGDLIISVDDEHLPDKGADEAQVQSKFISMIHNKGAGNTVRFGVYRDGQLLNLSIRLASYDTLIFLYTQGLAATLRPVYQPEWEQIVRKLEATRPPTPPLSVDLSIVPPAPAEGDTDLAEPFSMGPPESAPVATRHLTAAVEATSGNERRDASA